MAATTRSEAIAQINDLLPQTQCRLCGYDGCRPYAQALLDGDAEINRCPPGGEASVNAIAALLDRKRLPLDPLRGATKPPQVVVVDEAECIGCAKCLEVCPVDAIVGARKMMHTVIAEHCTGCELCIPPCPVDCIEVQVSVANALRWKWPEPEARERAGAAARRFEARQKRLAPVVAKVDVSALTALRGDHDRSAEDMRRYIDEAVQRTRQKRRSSELDINLG